MACVAAILQSSISDMCYFDNVWDVWFEWLLYRHALLHSLSNTLQYLCEWMHACECVGVGRFYCVWISASTYTVYWALMLIGRRVVLIRSLLPCSCLIWFVILCTILSYCVLFCLNLFYSLLFRSAIFYSVLFCSALSLLVSCCIMLYWLVSHCFCVLLFHALCHSTQCAIVMLHCVTVHNAQCTLY